MANTSTLVLRMIAPRARRIICMAEARRLTGAFLQRFPMIVGWPHSRILGLLHLVSPHSWWIPRLDSHRHPSIADSESFPSSQSIADSVHSAESDTRTAVSITPPPSVANVSMPTPVVPVTPPKHGTFSGSILSSLSRGRLLTGQRCSLFPSERMDQSSPQVPFQYAPVQNGAGAAMNQPFHWGPVSRIIVLSFHFV